MSKRIRQEDIKVGKGDVVAGDKIDNSHHHYDTRRNLKITRLFEALKAESDKDDKLSDICDELVRYLTEKDTIGLEQKLKDGGFNNSYIDNAFEQKEFFAKKLYRYQEFESAQRIYVELLALIKTNFQDYISPLIASNGTYEIINSEVREKVINPIIDMLNSDGANDDILNLNAEEVRGMLYYLTGRCHIKWSNDSI